MKSCFSYAQNNPMACSFTQYKAILLVVDNNPKWSKLPPYLFHCRLLPPSPLFIPPRPHWPPQCSSNTKHKILPLAFPLDSLPGRLFLSKLQSPLSPVSTVTLSVNPILTTLFRIVITFAIPRTSYLPCPALFFSIVLYHLYSTLTH